MENAILVDDETWFVNDSDPLPESAEVVEIRAAIQIRESLSENFSDELERWTRQSLAANGLKLSTSGLLAKIQFS